MSDTYLSMTALLSDLNLIDGTDYKIESNNVKGSDTIILAIHGGGIERGTSEVAIAVANECFDYYSFVGLLRNNNFERLHVTSNHFDEPLALDMVRQSKFTLSIHGFSSDKKETLLGGLDIVGRKILHEKLISGGFNVNNVPPFHLSGLGPTNICNQNSRGKGIQIEISTAQRQAFFANGSLSRNNRQNTNSEFEKYVKVLKDFMNEYSN